jgi:hypothetical protein
VWWEKREAEGEVGPGEDRESLDEDVGDGLVASEVRVELVAAVSWLAGCNEDTESIIVVEESCQIELIIRLQWAGGFKSQSLG